MHKLYVDRGPGSQATRFHVGCAQLSIELVHSKPYVSERRGAIERFNRTVKGETHGNVSVTARRLGVSRKPFDASSTTCPPHALRVSILE